MILYSGNNKSNKLQITEKEILFKMEYYNKKTSFYFDKENFAKMTQEVSGLHFQ